MKSKIKDWIKRKNNNFNSKIVNDKGWKESWSLICPKKTMKSYKFWGCLLFLILAIILPLIILLL